VPSLIACSYSSTLSRDTTQRPLAHKKTAKFHVPSLCGVHAVVSCGARVQGGLAFSSQGLEARTRAGILVCGV
jgi:hypothetical protein